MQTVRGKTWPRGSHPATIPCIAPAAIAVSGLPLPQPASILGGGAVQCGMVKEAGGKSGAMQAWYMCVRGGEGRSGGVGGGGNTWCAAQKSPWLVLVQHTGV